MATNTTHYNLIKPATTDFYDIADFNSNADTIDTNLFAKTNKAVTGTATLVSSSWTSLNPVVGEYAYKYELNVANVTSNDIFNGSVSLSTESVAQDCGLAQMSESGSGKVTFYCKNSPTGNIVINYNYIQGA